MDEDGYPDEETYQILSKLAVNNALESFKVLLQLFQSCGSGSGKLYKSADDVFYGKNVDTLELHTGGWSGCESMIDHLQTNNSIFWRMYWYSETRGGHYVFKGR